ncbi:Uncharacterised protein [Mycobacteroides abscessus subsp. massiliense]|nr:Uncharacterised protein [Mycobacteroides abscessus subsp. massiliense]
MPPNSTGEACPVTAEIKPSPRDANRRCTTSRRANTANASPAVKSSIDSAQKASTAETADSCGAARLLINRDR